MAEPNDSQSVDYVNGSDIQSDTAKSASDFASGPLGSLFQSRYNYNSLQYPADLNSSTKGHAIVFEISQPQSKSIQEVTNYAVTTANTAITAAENAIKNPEKTLNDATNSITTEGVKNFLETGFSTTAAEFMSVKKDLRAVVSLYMPDSLSFQYVSNHGEVSLMDAAASLPGIRTAAGFIQSVMEKPAAKLALNKMGYAFNPQEQVLFQGIDFRTFEMSFTFSPKSSQEAEQVQKIIKLFRTYAAPTIVTGAAGFFYTPPGVFNLSFRKDGAVNPNINKLTDCVLTNVSINYAPNGWSSYKDGHPVQTTMDLSFKETVLVDRAKIEQGY
jgi:spore coat protein CotF